MCIFMLEGCIYPADLGDICFIIVWDTVFLLQGYLYPADPGVENKERGLPVRNDPG